MKNGNLSVKIMLDKPENPRTNQLIIDNKPITIQIIGFKPCYGCGSTDHLKSHYMSKAYTANVIEVEKEREPGKSEMKE